MENMQDFIELGKKVRESGMRENRKFKSLIMNLQYMETEKIFGLPYISRKITASARSL